MLNVNYSSQKEMKYSIDGILQQIALQNQVLENLSIQMKKKICNSIYMVN